MTIARAEMSNAQSSDSQETASKGMSVALIGPNDAHRQIVARALSSTEGRKVHEFIDYPGNLNELSRMAEQNFDAVLVDVDTDQSYALQIVEKLSTLGVSVMAYSARTDQDLLMNCMRAGACDFLPLPTENATEPERPSPSEPPAVQQIAPKPPAPNPAPVPVAPPAPRSNVTTIAPERRFEPVSEVRPSAIFDEQFAAPTVPEPRYDSVSEVRSSAISEEQFAAPTVPERRFDPVFEVRSSAISEEQFTAPTGPEPRFEPGPEVFPSAVPEEDFTPQTAAFNGPSLSAVAAEAPEPEDALSDFAKWDAANLRPGLVPPPAKKPEARPRPSLVPDRRKNESDRRKNEFDRRKSETTARPAPAPEEKEAVTAPPIERPPVEVEIFRSSTFKAESEPDEAAEKKGANWVKWILIAAGPLVLALVLLIVFTRTSTPNTAAARAKDASSSIPAENRIVPGSELIVKATGKPTAALAAKPSSAQPTSPAAQDHAPVSPDDMAQQLVAPTVIAGTIKKTVPTDEPPPAAPAPVVFDDNNGVPGSVFGGSSKVKVVPHVVAISAGVADGMLIRKTPPAYPKFAQEAHIGGKVVLKATITKQGNIEGVQVLSGPKILAPAAVDAVKTWKYRPYTLDNQPVAVETSITVVFGSGGK